MDSLYFVFGIILAACAVIFSFLGLRSEKFGASKGAFWGLTGVMVTLVVATMVTAVIHARHEHKDTAKEIKAYYAKHPGEKPGSQKPAP